MPFEIRQANRTKVKSLIGFYGRSGSGKTMSALLFARGLVGPTGRIVLVDSESGRGSLFADIIPGGYEVMDIEPPFSPERYEEAIITAEAQADCVVVDSMSHEHNGEGGMLDMQEIELNRMAGDNWSKREACRLASFIRPKMAHKKFVQRLLRLKCALICCLRGEEKTHMIKGDDGKSKVITDEFSSPIYDSRFLFELLLNFETIGRGGQGGYVIPRKITHPSIAALLPKENEQVGIKHGAALAQWCAGGAVPAGSSSTGPSKVAKEIKAALWKLTAAIHVGVPAKLEQWLWDEGVISDTENLAGLAETRLAEVLEKAKSKMQ